MLEKQHALQGLEKELEALDTEESAANPKALKKIRSITAPPTERSIKRKALMDRIEKSLLEFSKSTVQRVIRGVIVDLRYRRSLRIGEGHDCYRQAVELRVHKLSELFLE